MARTRARKPIRVGVFGLGRGRAFLGEAAAYAGFKVVALCDGSPLRLEHASALLSDSRPATYTDFDAFLAHDMDAVVVTNYFHEHAPYAIRALESGRHVFSECQACHTPAEAVALVRAVEKSKRIYMFGENYPYMKPNFEMARLYRKGVIGEFHYGEGEYTYPHGPGASGLAPGLKHWRNWIPATYYCTHAIAPVMFVTDTRPVQVNGFVTPYAPEQDDPATRIKRADSVGLIVCKMDNGAYLKALQGNVTGGHTSFVRIHGTRGVMERPRASGGPNMMVRLYLDHPARKNQPAEQFYVPRYGKYERLAAKTGHGGGDFFMCREFAEAIRRNEPPFLDVYRGVAMSLAGILAYRSALQGSTPLEVPDLHKEAPRRRYAKDDWSPDPTRRRKGQPWPSITGRVVPTREAADKANARWRKLGKFPGL